MVIPYFTKRKVLQGRKSRNICNVFGIRLNFYRERVQNISASASIDDLDEYKTQIGQLSSGSTYRVRVVAHTSDGITGVSSDEIEVETSRDLDLPDPPRDLVARVLSASVIEINWSPPAPKATPVTGYKMYYMEVNYSLCLLIDLIS